MNARLISLTQPVISEASTAEQLIVYCARVSNPSNQANVETGVKLLAYCIRNKHWSIFEQASMTIEVKTSRAIAAQILRHRSFSFQEFSQRYAAATEHEPIEIRMQGESNRQGGEIITDNPHLLAEVETVVKQAFQTYDWMLSSGVAKESARMVLPLCTTTTLYMTANVRSWIHYFQQRLDSHAQKEHRELAGLMWDIFQKNFPETSAAVSTLLAD